VSRNKLFDDARPIARTEDVIVEGLDDDVIIYDTENNQAHALNPLAARIWKHCDGEHTVADLAGLFAAETPYDAVVNCLLHLDSLHLLNPGSLGMVDGKVLSRRQLLRKVAIGAAAAAIAVPMVTSIVAPRADAAASCQALNASCSASKPCCAGCTCNATTLKCTGTC